MKKPLLFLLIILCAASAYGRKNAKQQQKRYELIWHDEFDKDGRPGKDWTFEKGFVRNEELQWYQEENAIVKGGCLIIEGRKQRIENNAYEEGSANWKKNRPYAEYTSSSLTTRNSFSFRYGRVEVRAKIPTASGSWPAIWLLGNKYEWPQNGEIDMLEYYIKDGTPSILANACRGSNKRWDAVWNSKVTPLSYFTAKDKEWAAKFHIWRMDWDKDFIRLYLDDELLNEIDLKQTANQGYDGNIVNPFSNDIPGFGDYILLNLAIGANGGTPDDEAFPLRYEIDYVRVYRQI